MEIIKPAVQDECGAAGRVCLRLVAQEDLLAGDPAQVEDFLVEICSLECLKAKVQACQNRHAARFECQLDSTHLDYLRNRLHDILDPAD